MSTIIKTLEEYKAHIGGVQKEMYAKTWLPYVKQAESRYIAPELGSLFYAEIIGWTSTDAAEKLMLVQLLQAASAQYAYMTSIISMSVSKGDAGIMQNTPSNTAPMTKWQFVTLVKDARDKADSAFEIALKWLDANKEKFSTWTNSEEYKKAQALFLPSASMLTIYLPFVNDSFMFYKRLKGYIHSAEKSFIAPSIGTVFFQKLKIKAALANPQWSSTEEEMLDLLRSALAHRAFAESIQYLNINSDFRVVSETDGVVNEADLSDSRKSGLIVNNENQAMMYINKLLKHLNANASEVIYPDFFNSKLYKPSVKPLDKLPKHEDGQLLYL